MYKSKLQVLCQQRKWLLPEYDTSKVGVEHNPRFYSKVTINGLSFGTAQQFRSSKEAQNEAARLAFTHFSDPEPIPISRIPSHSSSPLPALPEPIPISRIPSHSSSPLPALPEPIPISRIPSHSSSPLPALPSSSGTRAFRSSKEAQNDAARLAFSHFLDPEPIPISRIPSHSSSPLPALPSSSALPLAVGPGLNSIHEGKEILQPRIEETDQNPQVPVQFTVQASGSQSQGNNSTLDLANRKRLRDIQHLHKNHLQTYAQKRNLLLPVYSCKREGPPHASRFKCSVTIDGQTYEGQEFLPTIKEAEHAAARVALMSLVPDGVEEEDDSRLYKNLLQELFQKDGLLPTYNTSRYGEVHKPIFVSTVEIGGSTFKGQEAKGKKQAEMSAAKVAYHALRERNSSEIVPSSSGNSSEVPLIPSTTQQGQGTSEILSSIFQSSPAVDLQQEALQDAPLLPKMIIQEQTYARVTEKGKSHHPTIVPSGPDALVTGGGFSPSHSVYGVSQSGQSSISPSDVSPKFVIDPNAEPPAKRSMSSYEKVSVYPRQPNMTFPEGATLLPASDDKWVALSHT